MMKPRTERQQGSALVIVLALSSALLLIIQAATTRVYTMHREIEFMEKKHNRTFRERHPDLAVESSASHHPDDQEKTAAMTQ